MQRAPPRFAVEPWVKLYGGACLDLPKLLEAEANARERSLMLRGDRGVRCPGVKFSYERPVLALRPRFAEVRRQPFAAPFAFDLLLQQIHGRIERAQGARLGIRAILGICFSGHGIHAIGKSTDN